MVNRIKFGSKMIRPSKENRLMRIILVLFSFVLGVFLEHHLGLVDAGVKFVREELKLEKVKGPPV